MLSRLGSGVALASVAALVLVGCTPDEPVETTPPPSVEPTAEVEEALAVARQAWDAYRAQLTEFGADPSSASLEPLQEVATQDVAERQLENFADAAARRVHTEGNRTTTAFEASDLSSAPASVAVNVCVDLTQERYVGDEGVDLTPDDREPTRASTVTFVQSEDSGGFLVASEVEFDGPSELNPCG